MKQLISGLLLLVLTGCSFYPLGMDKEDWAQLTPTERLKAAEKQADYDRESAEASTRQYNQERAQAEAEEAKWNALLP